MLVASLAIVVACVVLIVGVTVLLGNPKRWVNRAVFLGTIQMCAWLVLWHLTATSREGLYWLKWTCSIGALAPLNFWIVREAILQSEEFSIFRRAVRSVPWVLSTVAFALLPFLEIFIPASSTSGRPEYGWGYYLYLWGLFGLYVILFRESYVKSRAVHGAQRMELQVWLGGGSLLATLIYSLMFLSTVTGDPVYRRLQPLATLVFYAGTAYFITNYRIFDARELVLAGARKVFLVLSLSGLGFAVDSFMVGGKEVGLKWLLFGIGAAWLITISESRLGNLLRAYPQRGKNLRLVQEVAQRESQSQKLEVSFRDILKKWGNTDVVSIFHFPRASLPECLGRSFVSEEVLRVLVSMGWVTPERLEREKVSEERTLISILLRDNGWRALVTVEGESFIMLVGVGIRSSRRPYTYPQVVELMELAAIMESALERAHFAAKVQRTEQLATVGLVGASLAHEIRNPLVSIKTFVQLLPTHYADPAFREKFFRLIGDEVARIDELTQQLLDLAAPRSYQTESVGLHGVLRPGLELVEARAAERGVKVMVAFTAEPDTVFTDASAAKQVLLNLCFNAIQAVEAKGGTERWVRLSTRRLADGVELAVSDSGPGIAPEMQRRLFQPFQTTKSRGFGLGLAICRDILANVRATIAVDPALAGQGATFRVTFPCQAPSS